MAPKRRYDDTMKSASAATDLSSTDSSSAFTSVFDNFRMEIDAYHDRRERITKASRDITAASKKLIFALQCARTLGIPLSPSILKTTLPYHTTIRAAFAVAAPDLQGPLALRYARQISPGLQEWAEARLFQVYIERGALWTYDEAKAEVRNLLGLAGTEAEIGITGQVASVGGSDANIEHLQTEDMSAPSNQDDEEQFDMPLEDYLLGVYDFTGELMRFAITAMATSGALPSLPQMGSDSSSLSITSALPSRTLLTDLRQISMQLLALDTPGNSHFQRDAESKAKVMLASVEKVERALYGLVVRGSERPKGWLPDAQDGRGEEVESW